MGMISKSLRFEILTRDGYRCRYCGATAQTAVLHIDHVLPRSKGGRNDASNLVTACADCNHGKTDRRIVGIPAGFALTPDPRPARVERMRRKAEQAKRLSDEHVLNCYEIDSLDEIDDCNQIALVWCNTHSKFEWHSIPLDMVRHGGEIRTKRKPLWTAA